MRENVEYDRLIDIAQKNRRYLNGEIDPAARHTIGMAWNVISTLQINIDGVVGGFGVGFPFHSLTKSGEVIANPEFSRYSDSFLEKISIEKRLGHTAWICARCHDDEFYKPDFCEECEQTIIKPRDVMKVMPDVDMFVILNDISSNTLDDIQVISKDYSFHQSDHSALETLNRIDETFECIEQDIPTSHLPTDLHVLTKDDFIYAMNEIGNGNMKPDIDIYSMYYSWKLNKKISFGFDFVFSGTFNEDVCEPDIIEYVNIARKKLVQNFSQQEILDMIKNINHRADVLLEYGPTREAFLEKIRSWK